MKIIQLIKKTLWFLRFMISERKEDKKLGIRTCGRNDAYSDADKHPYEPTPYKVLEKLAAAGYIGVENTLLDYGCGKGRAAIFLSAKMGCRAIGVECEESFVSVARRNAATAGPVTCLFHKGRAETYLVPPEADRLFFFNPFSVELLRQVLQQVSRSYNEKPREILLFFYYPSKRYSQYLKTAEALVHIEDIDCRALFYEEDPREKIAVFRMR